MTRLNGSIVFYQPIYNFGNDMIMREDEKRCNGDCFDYLSKYMSFVYSETRITSHLFQTKSFEYARVCDADDIGNDQYNSGLLFICPPKKGLSTEGKKGVYPN